MDDRTVPKVIEGAAGAAGGDRRGVRIVLGRVPQHCVILRSAKAQGWAPRSEALLIEGPCRDTARGPCVRAGEQPSAAQHLLQVDCWVAPTRCSGI